MTGGWCAAGLGTTFETARAVPFAATSTLTIVSTITGFGVFCPPALAFDPLIPARSALIPDHLVARVKPVGEESNGPVRRKRGRAETGERLSRRQALYLAPQANVARPGVAIWVLCELSCKKARWVWDPR